jgi:hypothetical protein
MMLAGVVLCTLMLSTIDLSQSLVFAQNTTSITPSPELAGSNEMIQHRMIMILMITTSLMVHLTIMEMIMTHPVKIIMMTMMVMMRIMTPNKIHYQAKRKKLKLNSSKQTHC